VRVLIDIIRQLILNFLHFLLIQIRICVEWEKLRERYNIERVDKLKHGEFEGEKDNTSNFDDALFTHALVNMTIS
jgi:hypothetical protein